MANNCKTSPTVTSPQKPSDFLLAGYPSPSAIQYDPELDKILKDSKTTITVSERIHDSLIQPNPKGVYFAHCNAQSLFSHISYFTGIFNPLKLHVIAVTESWLKPSLHSNLVNLPGYNIIRHDRHNNKGGGIAIYVRDDITYKILSMSEQNKEKKSQNKATKLNPEYLIIELTICKQKLLFAAVYRPPDADKIDNFCNVISDFIPKYKHVIITGDFNTDLLKENAYKRKFKNTIESLNLNILPSKPTHLHSQFCAPSLLDLFITTNKDNILKNGQVEAPGLSHHDIIYLAYSMKQPKFTPKFVTYRDFKNIDTIKFREDAKKIPWDTIKYFDEVDTMVEIFNDYITQLINHHAPEKTVRVTHKPAPWRTKEIIESESLRDALFTKYKKSRLEADFVAYKKIRNKTNQMSRNSKLKYSMKKLNPALPSRTLWDNAKGLGIGKQKTDGKIPHNITLNALNTHFTTLPKEFDDSLKTETLNEIKNTINNNCNINTTKFTIEPVKLSDVKKIMKSIKTKAQGVDKINIQHLMLILDIILPALTCIINKSIQTNKFPTLYKHALVRPLPKCSNPENVKDFRPISILPVLSKVFEKVVYNQTVQFIDSDKYQSGFKAKHGTNTALLKITEDIRKASDNNNVTILALLDFSKAFDSINHDILIAKLKSLNFSPSATAWFQSYLSDRKQCVVNEGVSSSLIAVNNGVPQGSVLGPLLFSIYLIDAPKVLQYCMYHLYADDFQIYIHSTIKNLKSSINKLNIDLDSIHNWSIRNSLILNPIKTQALIIGHSRLPMSKIQQECPQIVINDVTVPFVKNAKNLGILLDNKLSWEEQAKVICKKVYGGLHVLYKLKKFIPDKLKPMLINSLIMPHFDYCDIIYTDLNLDVSSRLQRAQNSCVRFIEGLKKYDHVSAQFRKHKILNLSNRRTLHSLSLIYKTINTNNVMPEYIASLITKLSDTHSRTNRSKNTSFLSIPRHRTARYDRSFSVKYSRLWNDLPVTVREATSIIKFKQKLTSLLLASQ